MNGSKKMSLQAFLLVLLTVFALAWVFQAVFFQKQEVFSVRAQQPCVEITDPKQIPSPTTITFEELANKTVIGNNYRLSQGVVFENARTNLARINGDGPSLPHSKPNVAINDTTNSALPMLITFETAKTHVGFWLGNDTAAAPTTALVTALDADGAIICEAFYAEIPIDHTLFVGFSDPDQRISSISIDYGQSLQTESIDDFTFSPNKLAPTRTPLPTWTPIPTAKPTVGPPPTPTPVVPLMSYIYPSVQIPLGLLSVDYSIHGIEITEGIQCFNPSLGLTSCTDNSVPLVTKKDAAARIYLKVGSGSVSNVPVRLYLRANNVWYQADSTGKATTSINQGTTDSANVYFNVNFSSTVAVDFYAVVDPNNLLAESNEGNNRFPAVGYLTLNFTPRRSLNIVGERLRYHPSGYSGTQYAGGWAVNGGAVDWFEQVLPIRNNGVNYTVRSGYLDFTQSLGSGDNQHNLIKSLNSWWTLENVFSFWFSGAFTGARHVYGWAPSAGYSGGHADMPIYPHAGGLGVVGIGSDAAGSSTDNPGSGAFIFGHELVHDYNLYHTNTVDACGSNDGNSDFPYGNSSIQEFGFNPITGKIYDPATTHDLMSYCPSGGSKQGWIAPFTWTKMFGKLTPPPFKPIQSAPMPLVFTQEFATESLQVNASINNPLYNPPTQGNLGSLYRLPGGVAYALPQGDYVVELHDQANQILASMTFTVTFESEYDAHAGPSDPDSPPPFPPEPTKKEDVSFIMPWVDGTTQIVLTHLGEVIDSRPVSAAPPQVKITSPLEQETWLPKSSHALTWEGTDEDGDLLTYSIFYSNNGGATWILFDTDLTGTSRQINTDEMAGGSDTRFRVVATDGVNTGFDETDQAITIPNQPPQALVLSPENGSSFLPGSLVVLEGIGTDMEDGTLPDDALTWSSDVQGSLGIGPSLPLNVLSFGTHLITLMVKDSYGISSTYSVKI